MIGEGRSCVYRQYNNSEDYLDNAFEIKRVKNSDNFCAIYAFVIAMACYETHKNNNYGKNLDKEKLKRYKQIISCASEIQNYHLYSKALPYLSKKPKASYSLVEEVASIINKLGIAQSKCQETALSLDTFKKLEILYEYEYQITIVIITKNILYFYYFFNDYFFKYNTNSLEKNKTRIIYPGFEYSSKYSGDTNQFKKKPKCLYLVLFDNHYDVIRTIKSFLRVERYCHTCKKGYDIRTKHYCGAICNACYRDSCFTRDTFLERNDLDIEKESDNEEFYTEKGNYFLQLFTFIL